MVQQESVKISDAEWEVMRVVWTKEVTTSPEIIQILQDEMAWKPPTIKTLIGRLVKKEMLSTEQAGNKYLYRPLVSEKETFKSATETLFAHVCATKMGETIVEIIQQVALTHGDLALIKESLLKKEEVAVTNIVCNCLPGQCECHEHRLKIMGKEEKDNEKRV